MITAYRDPDRSSGRAIMVKLIKSVTHGVPAVLTELITLVRTLQQRADDVLAYFDRPGTSNAPTEAINGRLEHLRGSALGFHTSPTTSPDRCSRPDRDYTPDCEEPRKRSAGACIDVGPNDR